MSKKHDKESKGRSTLDVKKTVKLLNHILEMELAGVVRYTHYSMMVYGYHRIPIVGWLRAQAQESLAHAHQAGEYVTHLGEHPSLGIGPLRLNFSKRGVGWSVGGRGFRTGVDASGRQTTSTTILFPASAASMRA